MRSWLPGFEPLQSHCPCNTDFDPRASKGIWSMDAVLADSTSHPLGMNPEALSRKVLPVVPTLAELPDFARRGFAKATTGLLKVLSRLLVCYILFSIIIFPVERPSTTSRAKSN